MKTNVRTFTGPALAQVAFPLGGIGTGTVSLGGRGNFQDWEILNSPAKGTSLHMASVALRAKVPGKPPVAKIIERQCMPPFEGEGGLGRCQKVKNLSLPGVARFREVEFRGEYPFAWLDFQDEEMPVKVKLEAFNPFIPMNVEDSSIPGAILRYTIKNPQKTPVEVSLLAVLTNPVGFKTHLKKLVVEDTISVYREDKNGLRGLYFSAPTLPASDVNFGTASLTTDWVDTDVQTHLDRGTRWAHPLWDEFERTGRLTPLIEYRHDDPLPENRTKYIHEPGALNLHATLAPGEERTFQLFIHWHFPHSKLWYAEDVLVRHYVARQFIDAWDAARYTFTNLDRLMAETRRWHATLFDSTLPPEVLEAVSSQMSIIRSPTVVRLTDGNIYAWEGSGSAEDGGCCFGNCTHVWNYEQALAFLFPSLERTMRRIDFGPNMKSNGFMSFRCGAPSGATVNCFNPWNYIPAVDGQMGNIMQMYRDWQLCGDDTFLRELWPDVKRALEFAWTEPNGWDPNKDGVMEGCQHNTYDIHFYGPNSMLSGLYLGALRAAEEMARYLGEEDKAREYRRVYEKGRKRIEKQLWNGEYFIQQIEVMKGLELSADFKPNDGTGQSVDKDSACSPTCGCKPPKALTKEVAGIPKYQYGEGCLSDQLIGQWEAHVHGLGYILDPKKVRQTMEAIFKHNFRDPIGNFSNLQRVYALHDEAGLLNCSWPRGNRPAIPFVYSDEVWTGIEYQVAAHLIYEGLVEEGVRIVKAMRHRHNGVRRNPWNESECGWHYARALSSWSLIPALSGVQYSAVTQSLTFDPKLPLPFRCVVAAGSAWGMLTVEQGGAVLEVRYGQLTLREFGPRSKPQQFASPRTLKSNESVRIAN